jgi:hypothetical protein
MRPSGLTRLVQPGIPVSLDRFGMMFAAFPRKTQHVPVSKINEAFARLESGQARYRTVLDAFEGNNHEGLREDGHRDRGLAGDRRRGRERLC